MSVQYTQDTSQQNRAVNQYASRAAGCILTEGSAAIRPDTDLWNTYTNVGYTSFATMSCMGIVHAVGNPTMCATA